MDLPTLKIDSRYGALSPDSTLASALSSADPSLEIRTSTEAPVDVSENIFNMHSSSSDTIDFSIFSEICHNSTFDWEPGPRMSTPLDRQLNTPPLPNLHEQSTMVAPTAPATTSKPDTPMCLAKGELIYINNTGLITKLTINNGDLLLVHNDNITNVGTIPSASQT